MLDVATSNNLKYNLVTWSLLRYSVYLSKLSREIDLSSNTQNLLVITTN